MYRVAQMNVIAQIENFLGILFVVSFNTATRNHGKYFWDKLKTKNKEIIINNAQNDRTK